MTTQPALPLLKPLSFSVLLVLYAASSTAFSAENDIVDLGTTTVYAQQVKPDEYVKLENDTASIVNLDNQDTPQAMGTVTHAQIEDFELNEISDLLDTANAVKVDQVEPGRWYIRSRGFDVNNVYVDGVALPNIYNIIYGNPDTAAFDSVDIVRGANGMMNSFGTPSATLNLVRKMPTAKSQGKFKLNANQHKNYRVDGDVSGKLNDSGSIRGRLVGAYADGDSYLDRYQPNKTVLYGVLSADLTDNIEVSVGHEYNNQDDKGVMFGALPLFNNLGQPIAHDVSDSSAPSWATINGKKNNTFIKLDADFGEWNAKLSADHNVSTAKTFWGFVDNIPQPFFPLLQAQGIPTANALSFTPFLYDYETKITTVDGKLSREFELGGRTHEFGVGALWTKTQTDDKSFVNTLNPAASIILGNLNQVTALPQPSNVNVETQTSDVSTKEKAVYFSSRISPFENTNLFLGGRYVDYSSDGIRVQTGISVPDNRRLKKFSPSVGMSYNFNQTDTTLYANYSNIFNPQSGLTKTNQLIPATEGKNIEVGFKQSFNNDKAFVSANLYKTTQDDFAIQDPETSAATGITYSTSDIESKGFEVDISGRLTDRTSINGGLATVSISDRATGAPIRRGVPRQTFKLGMTHSLKSLPNLRVGGSLNFESATLVTVQPPRITDAAGTPLTLTAKQGGYGVVNLFAEYDVTKNFGVKLNVDNITDKKYVKTLRNVEFGFPQAYYAKPLTVSGSLIYKY